MVILTESLVRCKSKCTDLKSVTKLNLWGCSLTDVGIVKKMKNIKIFLLSQNKIASLKDFVNCKTLEELYLRKNAIENLSEILHLKKILSLRVLWLADNPCSRVDDYRLTVIRHLPSLIKLDNISITDLERKEASYLGLDLNIDVLDIPKIQIDDKSKEDNDVEDRQLKNEHNAQEKISNHMIPEIVEVQSNEILNESSDIFSEMCITDTSKSEIIPTFNLSEEFPPDKEKQTMSLEQTNDIRKKLGLKPLSLELKPLSLDLKISTAMLDQKEHVDGQQSEPLQQSSDVNLCSKSNNHNENASEIILSAALKLVEVLNLHHLEILQKTIEDKITSINQK